MALMDNFTHGNAAEGFCLSHLPKPFSPILRLNTLCPYFTMFPLCFPFDNLSRANRGEWVLDPFCGRGTTNYAARLRGLPSVGVDSSPIAEAISAAKMVNTKPQEIVRYCQNILNATSSPEHTPEGKFWDLCYHPDTLSQICRIRESLLAECTSDEAIALRALMLGILHGPVNKGQLSYLSNQMPRTYSSKPDYSVRYWEKNGLFPKRIDVIDVLTRKAMNSFSEIPPKTAGEIVKADSRELLKCTPKDGFSWVITSPPYFRMITYVQDQWLRNWFLGGPESIDYSVAGQLTHTTRTEFIDDLAKVWRNITHVCAPTAKLITRFGAIPSYPCDPLLIIQESIDRADCGWKFLKAESAGFAKAGRRQSEQFNDGTKNPREEIDYYAILT